MSLFVNGAYDESPAFKSCSSPANRPAEGPTTFLNFCNFGGKARSEYHILFYSLFLFPILSLSLSLSPSLSLCFTLYFSFHLSLSLSLPLSLSMYPSFIKTSLSLTHTHTHKHTHTLLHWKYGEITEYTSFCGRLINSFTWRKYFWSNVQLSVA